MPVKNTSARKMY